MVTNDASMSEIARLVELMARLRAPDGCPWDREQTFETIAPYTVEEAHEVADAIARQAYDELVDELGDLLLQIVFHAQMAQEAGLFTLADVARSICDKLERRHPHVFGSSDEFLASDEVAARWEDIKAGEKPRLSALDGVAKGLPALMRAQKISRRAAGVGFDWPDAASVRVKVEEELAELDAALTAEHREEEAGDLLFSIVNYLRHLKIDSETALRLATAKFERRFRRIEAAPGFSDLPSEEKEQLWRNVKMTEKPAGRDIL